MEVHESTRDGAPRSVRVEGPREAPRERQWPRIAAMCAGLLVLPLLGWVLFPPRAPSPPPKRAAPAARTSDAPPIDEAPARTADRRPTAPPKPAPAAASDTGPSLFGVVVGPDDQPVADASVRCTLRDRELTASTDEAGRFKLAGDAEGCTAIAKKRGFALSPEVSMCLGGDNRLRLGAGSGIAGTVVDPQGSPIVTYSIGVDSFAPRDKPDAGEAERPPALAVNEASGSFQLDDLPPGHYVLAATAARHLVARSMPIEVTPGQVVRGVKIVMRPGGTVIGTVVDARTKAPIVGAMIYAELASKSGIRPVPGLSVPPKGEFKLEGACPELCEVRAVLPGYEEKKLTNLRVPTSGEPLKIEIQLSRFGDSPR